MLADTGATQHFLLCLILAFNDIEANRPLRVFNISESICTRVAHLAFSDPVIYQDRQMDKSVTSGACNAYVTLDILSPIFSIARAVQQGHMAHFGGETPDLYLIVNAGNLNVQPYIPFVRTEDIDGVSGLKYFVPTKPLVIVPEIHFDIKMQDKWSVKRKGWGLKLKVDQMNTNTHTNDNTQNISSTHLKILRHVETVKHLRGVMGHRSVKHLIQLKKHNKVIVSPFPS